MKSIKDLKIIENKKLEELDWKALTAEIKTASKRLFELRMKNQLNELKQTHLITALRKYVAIMKTIANTKGFNID